MEYTGSDRRAAQSALPVDKALYLIVVAFSKWLTPELYFAFVADLNRFPGKAKRNEAAGSWKARWCPLMKHSNESDDMMGPQAPVRVMQVMEHLGMAPSGLSLGGLADKLDVPKSTLLGFLRALEAHGYVRNFQGVYRVGEQGIRLGNIISVANPFPSSLHETLMAAMRESGETALLAVFAENDNEAIYIDMVESSSSIRYSARIGTRRPLHCTAAGKALLAARPQEWVERYVECSELTAYTEHTIVERKALLAEIERIRRSGVSETRDAHQIGVSGFASNVYNVRGLAVAALVIAAPTSRAMQEREFLSSCAKKYAARMSALLGYK